MYYNANKSLDKYKYNKRLKCNIWTFFFFLVEDCFHLIGYFKIIVPQYALHLYHVGPYSLSSNRKAWKPSNPKALKSGNLWTSDQTYGKGIFTSCQNFIWSVTFKDLAMTAIKLRLRYLNMLHFYQVGGIISISNTLKTKGHHVN